MRASPVTSIEARALFTPEQLGIVAFIAAECEVQESGERSVGWMTNAWSYAQILHPPLVFDDVLRIGELVEPEKNRNGFRVTPVRVGSTVIDARNLERQVANLVGAWDRLSPGEWYYEFECVHPFVDGNGRSGAVLYNWLRGSLASPVRAPDLFGGGRGSVDD